MYREPSPHPNVQIIPWKVEKRNENKKKHIQQFMLNLRTDISTCPTPLYL